MGKIQFFRQISRVALIIFLPLFIATSSVLFAFYYFEIKSIEDLLLKDELQTLKVAKTRIADHFDLIVADLLFFSNYSQLLTMLNHPKVNIQNIANDLALFSRGSKIYDQVRIIDADGKESVRVNKVLVASGPVEAIDIAHKQTDGIDLLLSDLTMPDMNGRDLAKQILAICPNIKVLFMSGYIVNFSAGHDILDKEINLIQKPFSAKDLATKVFETLSRDKKS